MQKPKILITAAAGKTGMATALDLLRQGFPVRAMVRHADVQRAYFCPPLEPGTLRRATLFAACAQEARLEAVAVLSQWLSDPIHPAVHSREKWLSLRVASMCNHRSRLFRGQLHGRAGTRRCAKRFPRPKSMPSSRQRRRPANATLTSASRPPASPSARCTRCWSSASPPLGWSFRAG